MTAGKRVGSGMCIDTSDAASKRRGSSGEPANGKGWIRNTLRLVRQHNPTLVRRTRSFDRR